jgi:hypothetical protein
MTFDEIVLAIRDLSPDQAQAVTHAIHVKYPSLFPDWAAELVNRDYFIRPRKEVEQFLDLVFGTIEYCSSSRDEAVARARNLQQSSDQQLSVAEKAVSCFMDATQNLMIVVRECQRRGHCLDEIRRKRRQPKKITLKFMREVHKLRGQGLAWKTIYTKLKERPGFRWGDQKSLEQSYSKFKRLHLDLLEVDQPERIP